MISLLKSSYNSLEKIKKKYLSKIVKIWRS